MQNDSIKNIRDLCSVFSRITSDDDCQEFLRDLLTDSELRELSNRWKVAKMLSRKVPYLEIEKETGMSSTTIARINKALKEGKGYRKMITTLEKKKTS